MIFALTLSKDQVANDYNRNLLNTALKIRCNGDELMWNAVEELEKSALRRCTLSEQVYYWSMVASNAAHRSDQELAFYALDNAYRLASYDNELTRRVHALKGVCYLLWRQHNIALAFFTKASATPSSRRGGGSLSPWIELARSADAVVPALT